MEDIAFLTAITLEISSVKCFRCGENANNDVTKARLRNRNCLYDHAICIACVTVLMAEVNENEGNIGTEENRDFICSCKKCGIKTPFRCLRAMIGTVTGTCLKPEIFFRDADILEKCSNCRLSGQARGFKSGVACSHAMCKRCLEGIAANQGRWYNQCNGDNLRCKYIVPLRIIQDTCSNNITKETSTNDFGEPDVYSAPILYLDKYFDKKRRVLSLRCLKKSCCPMIDETWTLNNGIIDVHNKEKFNLIQHSTEVSCLEIFNVKYTDVGLYKCSSLNSNGIGESNTVEFGIPKELPRIELSYNEDSAHNVFLKAIIDSEWPIKRLEWKKNDKILLNDNNFFTREDDTGSILHILNKKELGSFSVVAENVAGVTDSECLEINLQEEPLVITLDLTVHKIKQFLELTAKIESSTALRKIRWLRDGLELDTTSSKYYASNNFYLESSVLFIYRLEWTDVGVYQIYAENEEGKAISNPVKFCIDEGSPKIKLSCNEDSKGNFFLKALIDSEWPIRRLEWRKDDKILKDDKNFLASGDDTGFTLHILDKKTTGSFRVVAENVFGVIGCESVEIKKQVENPVIALNLHMHKSKQSLELKAKIESSSTLRKLEWLKDGLELDTTSSSKYYTNNNFSLESPVLFISRLEWTDEGEYQIYAENERGKAISNPVKLCIDEDPPKIQLSYEEDSTRRNLFLKAFVESEWPIRRLEWRKDDKSLKDDKNFLASEDDTGFTLHILDKKTTGSFGIVAENVFGATGNACLEIKKQAVEPPIIELIMNIHKRKQFLELMAKIESSTALRKIRWLKDGLELDITSSSKYQISNNFSLESPLLFVSQLDWTDVGEYQIYAENEGGKAISNPVKFCVDEDPPKIKMSYEENSAFLKAFIDSEWPIRRLEWRKDDKSLKDDKNFFASKDDTGFILLIQDKKTTGSFGIVVENVFGATGCACLEIKKQAVEPPTIELIMNVHKRKQFLELKAKIESSTALRKIRWLKDDLELEIISSTKYSTSSSFSLRSPVLLISRLEWSDVGEYQIYAENEGGNAVSNPVKFCIDEDLPRIQLSLHEDTTLFLKAVIDSEWPIKSLEWQKDFKSIHHDNNYFASKDKTGWTLRIFDKRTTGSFRVIAESLVGVTESECKEIKTQKTQEIPRVHVTGSRSSVQKTREDVLVPVIETITRRKRCNLCGYNMAIGLLESCGHCFCRFCLETLKESALASVGIISCVGDCSSIMTCEKVMHLINDDEQTTLQTPLYFELLKDGIRCGNNDCIKMGFFKLLPCCHISCLHCVLKSSFDTICKRQVIPCDTYPPSVNFEHFKKSLRDEKINPFLTENCKKDKTCNTCGNNNPNLKIIRCGHSFCISCITIMELPAKEGQPFTVGKCLVEKCEELFPFPSSLSTMVTNPTSVEKTQNDKQDATPSVTSSLQTEKNDTSTIKRKQDNQGNSRKKQKSALLKSTGLSNVGLSCYRNTILQTLAEIPYFLAFLEKRITEKSPAWIGLLVVILKRIREENTGQHDMLEHLHHFHHEFNEKHTEYKEFQQEDTLSFLTSILNGLQEEFKRIGDQKEFPYKREDPSSLFLGALKTRYLCKECKEHEDFEGETFFSLPLPVKESKNKRGKATIGSCIQGFLCEEEIDVIPCSFCGSNNLIKEQMISEYPDVLVLQICKLEEATYSFDDKPFEKNRNRVLFWEDFSGLKSSNKKSENLKKALKHYRLVSVVEHYGSESSGHYICFVRRQNNQNWCRCDDSYVSDVSFEEVKRSDAYLLFYEKIDTSLH